VKDLLPQGFSICPIHPTLFALAPTDFRKRLVGVFGDVRLDYKDYLISKYNRKK
jgi:hypothetical protein